MKERIAGMLKELREHSKMSGSAVTDKLKEYGFNISDKTLYGYEKGVSMPNADMFVSLCFIYNCTNPIEYLFGNNRDTSIDKIESQYMSLNDLGKHEAQSHMEYLCSQERFRESTEREKMA